MVEDCPIIDNCPYMGYNQGKQIFGEEKYYEQNKKSISDFVYISFNNVNVSNNQCKRCKKSKIE